jgi:hypothetical protein
MGVVVGICSRSERVRNKRQEQEADGRSKRAFSISQLSFFIGHFLISFVMIRVISWIACLPER